MEKIKFSIVIPTRERADTLFHTIATCTSQDYDNLEIIVSDNFSNDNTRDVVFSFSDRRIKYINTKKRVSMSKNWEFALSHIHDGYVTYIGDDDGLLPNAINDISSIIKETKTSVLSWLKAEYCWPNHIVDNYKNLLKVCLHNKLFLYRANIVLRDAKNLWLAYNRTPTVYNSFTEANVLKEIKDKTGTFFYSITPDIYSGFAVLSKIEKFLYSLRPFSVNGASARSTGTSFCCKSGDGSAVNQFFSEQDIEVHKKMKIIDGSVVSCVAEALLQANDHCFNGKIKIDLKKVVRKILKEISQKEGPEFEAAFRELLSVAAMNKVGSVRGKHKEYFRNVRHKYETLKLGLDRQGWLSLNAERFGVTNVYDASLLIASIVGDYEMPSKIGKYSFFSKILSRGFQLAYEFVEDKTL